MQTQTFAATGSTAELGTRFRLFPQPPYVPGYEAPETVWVSTPPPLMRPGPADARIYVIDPVASKRPYLAPDLPPYAGLVHPPVAPGPDGHFDAVPVTSRAFLAAHVFGCVRRVLDVAEGFLGRSVPWFFGDSLPRLEIVPHVPWPNAHSGFGFLEMGEDDSLGTAFPLALNFDAVAHEVGHLVLLGTLGLPPGGDDGGDFLAYHEAVADSLSMLSLLAFDTALDRILRRTRGNLLIVNELDRIAELADEKPIRLASNNLKLSQASGEVHDRSRPFTGAVFDCVLDTYQVLLAERGLSPLDPTRFVDVRTDLDPGLLTQLLARSREDYAVHHFAHKAALAEARDIVGEALARSWSLLRPGPLRFEEAALAFLAAAETGRGARFLPRFAYCFAWREILPRA